jgi:hypothetical protein
MIGIATDVTKRDFGQWPINLDIADHQESKSAMPVAPSSVPPRSLWFLIKRLVVGSFSMAFDDGVIQKFCF